MQQTLSNSLNDQINERSPGLQAENPDLIGKTIMIVEDVPSNYQLLYAYFSKSGVKIIHVDNGMDAVAMISDGVKVDLIIMDIRLPKLNGLMATQQIRTFRKDIPIIAQTAFAMQSDREMCLKAGCDEFLAKPFRKQELMRIMSKLI